MNSAIERPQVADRNDPRFYSIKTGAVKAVKTGDGKHVITGTASSSVVDRYGDLLTEGCQASMLSQVDGLTGWLNHSYNVPEDVAGTFRNPTLERRGDALDLDVTLEIDDSNPRALKCWQNIQAGTKLAFSIGGYFKDFDLNVDGDTFGLVVNDVELLEISLVGIPANPRAYTKEKMFEGLRAEVARRMIDASEKSMDVDEVRTLVRKSFGLEEIPPKDLIEVALDAAPPVEEVAAADPGTGEVPIDPVNPIVEARSAEDVNDAMAATKALDDPQHCAQIVECMKCIKNCVNCAGHQMCAQPMAHASAAHAILKSLLPDNYELPDDATLDAPAPTTLEAPVPATASVDTALDAAMEEQRKQLSSEIETLTASKDALVKEASDLETQIAKLKATPTGRQTAVSKSADDANPGGSSKRSEPYYSASTYYGNNENPQ